VRKTGESGTGRKSLQRGDAAHTPRRERPEVHGRFPAVEKCRERLRGQRCETDPAFVKPCRDGDSRSFVDPTEQGQPVGAAGAQAAPGFDKTELGDFDTGKKSF